MIVNEKMEMINIEEKMERNEYYERRSCMT